ncbi:MAG TPA: LacI family DNA-binding transcriptional regulator [Terracidiphilus sp.]|jgi:LacI family transcriptional regulator
MKDIAERAGVSLSAVSLVLSGRRQGSISSETREHILAIVDDLGYRPNRHARTLATGLTNNLGVFISEISNPFFPEIIRNFELAATAHEFETQIVNTEYDQRRAAFSVRKIIDDRVCGIAIFTSQFEQKLVDEIARNHIPIVLVGSRPAGPWISRISIDFAKGLEQLLGHLVGLGHRHFAAIVGPKGISSAQAYATNLKRIARKKGLQLDQVLSCNYRHDGGMQSVSALVHDPNLPTAIFCANDLIAMGAISALEQAGIRVPQDVSIVGFDDIVFARLARPPLTTSAVPREELGTLAFQMISKMIGQKRPIGESRVLAPTLVVRGSTAPPRKSPPRAGRGK